MKKLLPRHSMSFIFMLAIVSSLFSQNNFDPSKELAKDPRVSKFKVDADRGTPSLIKFNSSSFKQSSNAQDITATLSGLLALKNSPTYLVPEREDKKQDVTIHMLQQYFKGVKVEHGRYNALVKNENLKAVIGEFYNINEQTSTNPGLTEQKALEKAMEYVGASKFAWEYVEELASKSVNIDMVNAFADAYEKYFPEGELVFVDNYSTKEVDLSLAYKFNIYAAEPLSRGYVYVDANSGNILLNDAIIKHAEDKTFEATASIVPGNGDTRYAGNRSFDTTLDAGTGEYSLIGVAINGIINETRSLDGLGGIPLSVPALYAASVEITDNDNSWTAAEHRPDDFTVPYPAHNEYNNDDIALDAHWGAEVVLQYWFEKHNRSSYDNLGTQVYNFVHYGDAYDNAFWNGEAMTYGDGSAQQGAGGGFLPLTSMDVCSHEIGHGVCEFTSNLVYQRESGAMNEGFSDIWAAAVENYVLTEVDASLPYQPFGIGEQIDNGDNGVGPGTADTEALRWMDDPKAAGDPDSYGGDFWREPECGDPTLANDYCGVHTNSGVLNKWYYLLVMGSGQTFSPGANKATQDDEMSDGGRNYSVTGVGYTIADQITFMGETLLTPNSKFVDMREASILAAETLYSINEVEQVTNAWYAVDIGDAYDPGIPDRIFFNTGNPMFTTENTVDEGCNASKIVSMGITAIELATPQTITIDFSASTATLGQDYDLSQTEFTFPAGSSSANLDITIYNDGIVENSEEIQLSFTYNSETSNQILEIADNDIVPVIGNEAIALLETETFDTSDIPAGWGQITVDELSPNLWNFNGTSQAAGKAYISNGTGEPTYDINVASNTILTSPTINALGFKNIQVVFDWEAGGERDVPSGTVYDYGEFLYSTDGVNFFSVDTYTGTNGGNTVATGTVDMVIPALTNTQFVLGWRWFNDSLVGSAFSFTIDNVSITGTPSFVETLVDASDSNSMPNGSGVYFVSSQNGDVIARIHNVNGDLGCVQLVVRQEGTSETVEMPAIEAVRASKVIELIADGPNAELATYDITLFFTTDEYSNFPDINELRVLKVNDPDINAASDTLGNYAVDGGLVSNNEPSGYSTFGGGFKGSGTFSIATGGNIILGTQESTFISEMVLFPSPAKGGDLLSISGNTPIDTISIFDVKGVLVGEQSFSSSTSIQFSSAGLSSGFYFVVVNGDRAKTLKFVIQ